MVVRQRWSAAVLAAILGVMLLGAAPVAGTTVGTTEGCTPGYWKNHVASWQEYSASGLVTSAFSGAGGTGYASWTLLQALQGGGGPGVAGAQQILLRAATAALLNASYDPLLYPWQRAGSTFRPPLVASVNAALGSNNRSQILALASWLDADNNLGCPLN